MADPAQPVLDQPAAVPVPAEPDQVPGEQDEAPAVWLSLVAGGECPI